jgi:hypothetical protein
VLRIINVGPVRDVRGKLLPNVNHDLNVEAFPCAMDAIK